MYKVTNLALAVEALPLPLPMTLVGDSEVVYSHRRRQRRAKRDAFARYTPQLYRYWLVYRRIWHI
jgi:hypothetical protein